MFILSDVWLGANIHTLNYLNTCVKRTLSTIKHPSDWGQIAYDNEMYIHKTDYSVMGERAIINLSLLLQ